MRNAKAQRGKDAKGDGMKVGGMMAEVWGGVWRFGWSAVLRTESGDESPQSKGVGRRQFGVVGFYGSALPLGWGWLVFMGVGCRLRVDSV